MHRSATGILLAFLCLTLIFQFYPITNASPNPVISTVWREYPHIAPHLIETSIEYIYVTDWGNYSFSKDYPYICKYVDRNGTQMVSFSTFWINTNASLVPLYPKVVTATDTNFTVQYDAYKKLKREARIIQYWDFNRTDKPKISVIMIKTAVWDCGDFNIFWVVAGLSYVKENETSVMPCNKTMSKWKSDVKVEMANTSNPEDWQRWLIVDWNDEGICDVSIGQFTIFDFNLAVVKVDFTLNDAEVDPSLVGTSTSSVATHYPFQSKSFPANGYHYAIFSDGSSLKLFNSPDGAAWTDRSGVLGGQLGVVSMGRKASVAYSSSLGKFDIVSSRESGNDRLVYQRFTPNADGTVSSVASEQLAVPAWMDEDGRNPVTAGSIYLTFRNQRYGTSNRYLIDVRGSSGLTYDYTTTVNIRTYGTGYKFVFTPFATVTVPVGTSLPTTFQNKGWQAGIEGPVAKKLWILDGRFTVTVRVQNPDAIVHAGNLYARLWISPNSDMSGATPLTDWSYTSVSFSGTAGQVIDVTINLDKNLPVGDAFAVKGQYLYVELLWDVTTAATNARVQVESNYGASYFSAPNQIIYYPCVAIDSNGYPWIGFGRYNGLHFYPYIIKGDANNGTFDFRLSSVRKLSATGYVITRSPACPVSLTDGKIYVIYSQSNLLGQLWNGISWSSEEIIATASNGLYFNVVADGDNVELVFSEYGTYDIEYWHRTYGVGWASVATVEAAATSTSAPVLSIDPATGKMWCFWAGSPIANHIYYKKYDGVSWDADPTDWIDESVELLTANDRLTSFCSVGNSKVGLLYMTKTASPYNVKFAYLQLTVKQWHDMDTLSFNVLTKTWRWIDSLVFNVSTKKWNLLETLNFQILTKTWFNLDWLNFNILTKQWNLVDILNFNILTKTWNILDFLGFNVLTKLWHPIDWIIFNLQTGIAKTWHIIDWITFNLTTAGPFPFPVIVGAIFILAVSILYVWGKM